MQDYNKNKIIVMSHLAMMDKSTREKDLLILEHYKNDYIYKKNIVNRIFIYVGYFILLLIRIMHMLLVEGNMPSYQSIFFELGMYGKLMILFLVFITVIGTFHYANEYDQAVMRNRRYLTLLNSLDQNDIPPTMDKSNLKIGEF